MRGYDYTTEHPFGSHRDLRAVVQAAHDLAFGTLLKLIGRQEQTRLDERMIKGRVLLATGHKTCQRLRNFGSSHFLVKR
jgi:hypothetical protein